MNSKQSFEISGVIRPTLVGMDKVVSDLKKGLEEGTTKIDINKAAGSNLMKLIEKYEGRSEKFSQGIKDGFINIEDTKKIVKEGESVIDVFDDIRFTMEKLQSMKVIDAKKFFPDAFNKEIDNTKKALESFSAAQDKIEKQQIVSDKAARDVQNIRVEIDNLKKSTSQGISFNLSVEDANKKLNETKEKVNDIREAITERLTLELDEKNSNGTTAKKNAAKKKLEETNNKINGFNSKNDLKFNRNGNLTYKGLTEKQWQKEATAKNSEYSPQQIAGAQKVFNNVSSTYDEKKVLEAEIKQLEARENTINAFRAKNIGTGETDTKNILKMFSDKNLMSLLPADEVKAVTEAVKELGASITDVDNAATLEKLNTSLSTAESRAKKEKEILDSLQKPTTSIDDIIDKFQKLGITIDATSLSSKDGIKNLENQLDKLDENDLDKLKQELASIGDESSTAAPKVDNLKKGLLETAETSKELSETEREIQNLKNQVTQFFSIGNTIEIFKKSIRSAYETVKELDSAMAEIAVVSDFSVGDMWGKLPEFTKQANDLGVAVKDTYDATALYIQQGLDLEHSMELSNETLKMARIAGMEASAATDAMTTSLRGFNMELTGDSARRVDDVYSKLAAVTASDTQELATAMSKVASLAHSVNMEFENTSAFLAQGIETTRESAETIGTALTYSA